MSRDLLIITPPFSPFDAGPPLGPAVLLAHARAAGLNAEVLDLNIRFLRQFAGGSSKRLQVVGDHAKDRVRVEAARRHFVRSLELPAASADRVPCCADPVLSLPHDFNELDHAAAEMLRQHFWPAFLDATLGDLPAPRILGVSIMGPAQVLPAVVVARFAKQIWPKLLVIAGGSHVTLLADAIAGDVRYGHDGTFDAFLPGHSEQVLVDFVRAVTRGLPWPTRGIVLPGQPWRAAPELQPGAWLAPVLEPAEVQLYDTARLSLPVQLSRGCSYGKCRFCTYPAVEAWIRSDTSGIAASVVAQAAALRAHKVSVKDSLFDRRSMDAFGRVVADSASACTWSCTTKLNAGMHAAWLAELRAAGLRTVELGVETIHPRLQKLIDKPQPLALIESVVADYVEAGVAVVLNLLYGLPGETEVEAQAQLAWFETWRRRGGGLVHGSHNLVEVNRSSPFAESPGVFGIRRGAVGPWAFSYQWNAPTWRTSFAAELTAIDVIREAA
jgi:hypothetical protein